MRIKNLPSSTSINIKFKIVLGLFMYCFSNCVYSQSTVYQLAQALINQENATSIPAVTGAPISAAGSSGDIYELPAMEVIAYRYPSVWTSIDNVPSLSSTTIWPEIPNYTPSAQQLAAAAATAATYNKNYKLNMKPKTVGWGSNLFKNATLTDETTPQEVNDFLALTIKDNTKYIDIEIVDAEKQFKEVDKVAAMNISILPGTIPTTFKIFNAIELLSGQKVGLQTEVMSTGKDQQIVKWVGDLATIKNTFTYNVDTGTMAMEIGTKNPNNDKEGITIKAENFTYAANGAKIGIEVKNSSGLVSSTFDTTTGNYGLQGHLYTSLAGNNNDISSPNGTSASDITLDSSFTVSEKAEIAMSVKLSYLGASLNFEGTPDGKYMESSSGWGFGVKFDVPLGGATKSPK